MLPFPHHPSLLFTFIFLLIPTTVSQSRAVLKKNMMSQYPHLKEMGQTRLPTKPKIVTLQSPAVNQGSVPQMINKSV